MNGNVTGTAGSQAALRDAAMQALNAWKGQFETALKIVETLTEASVKLRERQLEEAADAHASAVAAHQSAGKDADVTELLLTESRWMQHNLEHAAAYWRSLFETSLEANATLVKCLLEQLPATGQSPDPEAAKDAMLQFVESACGQWLEASRRICAMPADLVAGAAGVRPPSAGKARGKP